MSFIIQIRDASSGRYEFEPLDDYDSSLSVAGSQPQTMPLTLRLKNSGESWTLPFEAQVSVTGSETIIKRNVAKAANVGGSIKERWAQNDWEINIEGYFINPDGNVYPKAAVEKLKTFCQAGELIEVTHEGLNSLGITYIVIEDYDFPFTAGPENQQWSIKALSDKEWQLLVKE